MTTINAAGLGSKSSDGSGGLPDQQANGDTPAATQSANVCSVCTSAVGRSACTVSCATYTRSVHLKCLVVKYKDTGVGVNKNSLEWLNGFIKHAGLQYMCQVCAANIGNTQSSAGSGNPRGNSLASSDNKQISILRDEISAIGKRVDNLQSNILAKIQSLVDALSTTPAFTGYAAVDDAAKAKSPSSGSLLYVSAVTKNLHETVKTAVAETICKQCIDERTNATMSVHGLAERGHDYDDLHDMLSQLRCKAKVVGCVRFSHAVKSSDENKQSDVSSKPRLLKVELQSSIEKDNLLVAAKKLKAN